MAPSGPSPPGPSPPTTAPAADGDGRRAARSAATGSSPARPPSPCSTARAASWSSCAASASHATALAAGYERLTRYRGPVTLRPSIVHVAGGRVVELTGVTAVAAATDLHDDDADDVYLVGRPT